MRRMGSVEFDTRVNMTSGICPDVVQSVRPKSIRLQLFLLAPDTICQGAGIQCFSLCKIGIQSRRHSPSDEVPFLAMPEILIHRQRSKTHHSASDVYYV